LMGSATARRAAHLRDSKSSAPVSCARAHCGTQTSDEGRSRRQVRGVAAPADHGAAGGDAGPAVGARAAIQWSVRD
jgi:hypothetical protein